MPFVPFERKDWTVCQTDRTGNRLLQGQQALIGSWLERVPYFGQPGWSVDVETPVSGAYVLHRAGYILYHGSFIDSLDHQIGPTSVAQHLRWVLAWQAFLCQQAAPAGQWALAVQERTWIHQLTGQNIPAPPAMLDRFLEFAAFETVAVERSGTFSFVPLISLPITCPSSAHARMDLIRQAEPMEALPTSSTP